MSNSAAAPTGCFKCGRPGHWSRDCPSSAENNDGNSNNRNNYTGQYTSKRYSPDAGGDSSKPENATAEKPRKVPKTRPKLTPELLLSDDGIGYILRHFPRAFKYHGRGHEVVDLGNLINLYSEWHSRLLPYHPFNKFVHKVEQVGTTRRVKMCVRELRERVANGGDPTKLHDYAVPPSDLSNENEAGNYDELNEVQREMASNGNNPADAEDSMLQEIFISATETTRTTDDEDIANDKSTKELQLKVLQTEEEKCSMTEEQKLRMEANRLKAMERAAARRQTLEAI